MAEQRTIHFNKLPKSVRERLIASIAGQASPYPVLSDRASGAGTAWWIILALVCGGALLKLTTSGYGSAYDSFSVQHPAALLAYIGLLFLVAYSVLAIIRRKRLASILPFTPGRYLFPMDFVDARDPTLRLIPMAALVDLSAVHHHTNGVYTHTLFTFTFEGGKTESFSVNSKSTAEGALQALKSSRAAISEAVKERNIDMLAGMDAFFMIRVQDAWDNPPADKDFEPGPKAGEMPPWLKKAALVALAPAAVVGPLVWFMRNRLSDDRMFERAALVNTEDAFEDYLRYGRRHEDEVRQDLIWKAALNDAKKVGTSKALDAFVRKYPDAPVSKEILTDTLPRLALKEAVDQNTVSAVREFLKTYPASVVDKEAHDEVHKLFVGALEAFRPQASKADPKMLPFVERLLKYLEEKESPPVLVTFRGTKSSTLELADKLLQKQAAGALDIPSLPGLGGASLAAVSPHFSDDRSAPREAAIVSILQEAFATIFPADVLPLKQGARRTQASQRGATVTEPSIEIDYEVGWSGSTYSSESSGREFVGIKIDFQVAMRLPAEPDKEALRFKLNVAPPDHFTVNYFSTPSPFIDQAFLKKEGPTDEKVYEVMAARAFDELSVKLRGVFFKEGSGAFEGKPKSKPKGGAQPSDTDDDLPPI